MSEYSKYQNKENSLNCILLGLTVNQGCIHGLWSGKAKMGRVQEGRSSGVLQGKNFVCEGLKLGILAQSGVVPSGLTAR